MCRGGGKNLYTNNNPEDKTYAWNPNSNSTKRPSLDLYYQRSLPHKQTMSATLVRWDATTWSRQVLYLAEPRDNHRVISVIDFL